MPKLQENFRNNHSETKRHGGLMVDIALDPRLSCWVKHKSEHFDVFLPRCFTLIVNPGRVKIPLVISCYGNLETSLPNADVSPKIN